MQLALQTWLDAIARHGDFAAAVVAAAEAESGRPWDVIANAGLLARCRPAVAPEDIGLDAALRVVRPDSARAIARVPAGSPYPIAAHPDRTRRGAFDTPRDLARALVGRTLSTATGPVRRALDPTCGTGAFLLALSEASVPEVVGADIDELALAVARIAVPGARLSCADGLLEGPSVDVMVGNPPFVPPEHQDKALRAELLHRFPWLEGRFDLAVPFAAVAVSRVRPGGGAGLVLPAPALVQPYGAPLRRQWLSRHAIVAIDGPEPFRGAAVSVVRVVMRVDAGPAPLPVHGLSPDELLRLKNAPLDPRLKPGDVALVEKIRAASVPLGDLCVVDTGVVSHRPGGTREHLLFDEADGVRVPYADAKDFFAGRRRWLSYRPAEMHRPKRPELFEAEKIVVQRLIGGAVRAAVDRTGTYVGHTCTIAKPRATNTVPIDRLCALVVDPIVLGILRIERGERLDLYPRDLASMPVPSSWLRDPDPSLTVAWRLTGAEIARLTEVTRR